MSQPIFVKVARTGAPVREVSLESGSTVADALRAAQITLKDNETIRIEGEEATRDDTVNNGEVITLSKNVEGGNN